MTSKAKTNLNLKGSSARDAQIFDDILSGNRDKLSRTAKDYYHSRMNPVFTNFKTPRPLSGATGVPRRGKIKTFTQVCTVEIGSNGVGYIIFNPDVGEDVSANNSAAFVGGPYNNRPIVRYTSGSTFAGTTLPATTATVVGETVESWKSSKYVAGSAATEHGASRMQWMLNKAGLAITRVGNLFDQAGSICLYNSVNGGSLASFALSDMTGSRRHRLITSLDTNSSHKISLSCQDVSLSRNMTYTTDAPFHLDTVQWHGMSITRADGPISGSVAYFSGPAGLTFDVTIVGEYLLTGLVISPITRFFCDTRMADLIANAIMTKVVPGWNGKEKDARKGHEAGLYQYLLTEAHDMLSKGVGSIGQRALNATKMLAQEFGFL